MEGWRLDRGFVGRDFDLLSGVSDETAGTVEYLLDLTVLLRSLELLLKIQCSENRCNHKSSRSNGPAHLWPDFGKQKGSRSTSQCLSCREEESCLPFHQIRTLTNQIEIH